jgi:sugar phosphate isomerase/epimerase
MIRLGTVTYNIAKDWTLPELLKNLELVGFEGVELRTTHKHGVEPSLSAEARREIRKRFEDSPVELAGIGSACEYHSPDSSVVSRQIEDTKAFVRLAHDIGAPGVKVRPNGLPKGENPSDVIHRIGDALRVVGEDAEGFGVQIRVEVHGGGTQEWPTFAQLIEAANHPNVYVCWNSNPTDVKAGSVRSAFESVASKIRLVHLRDLTDEQYPWRELFRLLVGAGYDGFTLAEIPESPDPLRVLRYFRSLWMAYQPGEKEPK